MQKILKWFTPVLALGVAVFIVFFLISINSSSEHGEVEEPLTHESETVQEKPKKLWLEHFSKTERLGYSYPVNEVYVKVDLKKKVVPETIYKLSASLLDPYQLFCLKEELRQHNLRYYLKKDKNKIELYIFSKSIVKLNSLVKILKNYQISAKIVPYKEDV